MIGQIKVLVVNGRNYPISDKLFDFLNADAGLEGEISKIIADAGGKAKKAGKKK
jgi:hypothetical protein